MVFYVFQGKSFVKESKGGYIWAPITNSSGRKVHHWDRLLDVRAGDIILHGYRGNIEAISIACGESYNCEQPIELSSENLWDKDGRRVDCNYILIQRPIKTANYKDEILKFSSDNYYPFNKDGKGNMGYLYEINNELACIFIKESIKANPYLRNYEAICAFINDND